LGKSNQAVNLNQKLDKIRVRMSKVLFTGSPFIGLVLLLLMLNHALQLVEASSIVQSLARQ